MSNKTNDNIREHIQEMIDGCFDIPTYLRNQAQEALKNDDLESAIDFISEGIDGIKKVLIEREADLLEMKEDLDEYSEDYPIGGMCEPYDIEREKDMTD